MTRKLLAVPLSLFLFTMTRGFEDTFHLPSIQDPSVFLLLSKVTFLTCDVIPPKYISQKHLGYLCNHVPFCLLFVALNGFQFLNVSLLKSTLYFSSKAYVRKVDSCPDCFSVLVSSLNKYTFKKISA